MISLSNLPPFLFMQQPFAKPFTFFYEIEHPSWPLEKFSPFQLMGITLDSIQMQASIPSKRLSRALEMLSMWSSKRKCFIVRLPVTWLAKKTLVFGILLD